MQCEPHHKVDTTTVLSFTDIEGETVRLTGHRYNASIGSKAYLLDGEGNVIDDSVPMKFDAANAIVSLDVLVWDEAKKQNVRSTRKHRLPIDADMRRRVYAFVGGPNRFVGELVLDKPAGWMFDSREGIVQSFRDDKVTSGKCGMFLGQPEAERWRGDRDVVREAMLTSGWFYKEAGGAFRYATAELRADRAFVLEMVGHNAYAVQYAAPALKEDVEVAAAVLKSSSAADKHLAEAVVMAAQEKLGITPVGYLTKETVAKLVRTAMRDHPELQQATRKEVRSHLEATLGDLSKWKDQIYDAYTDFLTAAPDYSGEVVTLPGATDNVKCVEAAPDGRIITSSQNMIKVWLRDLWPEPERTIEAHRGGVNAVAVLPGGVRFVSGGWDGTAKLWTFNGALERTFEVGYPVLCVAALPDGLHFVIGTGRHPSGDRGYDVSLYQVDGPLVHTFNGHGTGGSGNVSAVAVTRDGEHIISGSADRTVKVWSVATKSLVSTCIGHTNAVSAVAAMPDGQRILSSDKSVRVWLMDGTLENTFFLHTGTVNALVALPDNQCALSGSNDKTIKLFNVNDGSVHRIFPHHTNIVCCLALLPDGLRFVSGSEDNTACIVYHS
jgi:hypothetical protein